MKLVISHKVKMLDEIKTASSFAVVHSNTCILITFRFNRDYYNHILIIIKERILNITDLKDGLTVLLSDQFPTAGKVQQSNLYI
jgi:hypothetical protein